jgi:hypothetical protein
LEKYHPEFRKPSSNGRLGIGEHHSVEARRSVHAICSRTPQSMRRGAMRWKPQQVEQPHLTERFLYSPEVRPDALKRSGQKARPIRGRSEVPHCWALAYEYK